MEFDLIYFEAAIQLLGYYVVESPPRELIHQSFLCGLYCWNKNCNQSGFLIYYFIVWIFANMEIIHGIWRENMHTPLHTCIYTLTPTCLSLSLSLSLYICVCVCVCVCENLGAGVCVCVFNQTSAWAECDTRSNFDQTWNDFPRQVTLLCVKSQSTLLITHCWE